jgi:hypothetical protein
MSNAIQSTDTPVLLILFNRPEKVRQLIEALSLVRPKYVYVAADGPRLHSVTDAERCEEVRSLVNSLPWDCEVFTQFQSENLGCKKGVITAIDWFFDNVQSGIILEDDCIPSPFFFNFASKLLTDYQDDELVMHISGSSFIKNDEILSYYYSKVPLIWGWATWKRAWRKYDVEMSEINQLRRELREQKVFKRNNYAQFWIELFRHVKIKDIDTWDTQWFYTVLKNEGICLSPTINLVENVGFGADATHTKEASSCAQSLTTVKAVSIRPLSPEVDIERDAETIDAAFLDTPKQRIKCFVKSLI